MYLLTKLAKHKIVLSIIAVFVIGMVVAPALPAAANTDPFGIGYGKDTGLGSKDIRTTISSIINVALGLLGIVAVVIILWGGFVWMTAGGNDEKVGEARKIIFSGIIGLAIVLSAYAIAAYVLNKLGTATMGSENYTEYTGTVE